MPLPQRAQSPRYAWGSCLASQTERCNAGVSSKRWVCGMPVRVHGMHRSVGYQIPASQHPVVQSLALHSTFSSNFCCWHVAPVLLRQGVTKMFTAASIMKLVAAGVFRSLAAHLDVRTAPRIPFPIWGQQRKTCLAAMYGVV